MATPKSMEDFILPEMEDDGPAESKEKFDPYTSITNRIVEFFESASKDSKWEMPWIKTGFPCNASTGRHYNGLNVLLLWIAAESNGWNHPFYLTFNQIKALQKMEQFKDESIRVRKGSKATQVCFWKILEKKAIDRETGAALIGRDGLPLVKKIFLLRLYNVFNVAQLETSDRVMEYLKRHGPELVFHSDNDRNKAFEKFVANLGVTIRHGGNRAAYSPVMDYIQIPNKEQFNNLEAYYATLGHEEGHATGHESRLNRNLKNRFGDSAYAFEELIAELSAAFICADFRFESKLQHPEYVTHWCTVMRGDSKAIFTAASQATQAVKWMWEQQPKVTKAKSKSKAKK